MLAYAPKQYAHLLGLQGLSDTLLKNHFTLYEGYVTNVNKIITRLTTLTKTEEGATIEYAELKRRFGWEWNGMRLHELYFENLTKETSLLDTSSTLHTELCQSFGSLALWEKDFRATGSLRGIGWVVLVYDTENKQLLNLWINEHDLGHLAGAIPLLIMDVFEHAFALDYGIKRADYIEVFCRSINWSVVTKRFLQ
ncbi:MAG TPA: Fe-Mn family superoxide dismutase [Patescibacteria group bacterium]|nr:Fe-Mn family superoxide dismutase [Patescibacteria group bacterium]